MNSSKEPQRSCTVMAFVVEFEEDVRRGEIEILESEELEGFRHLFVKFLAGRQTRVGSPRWRGVETLLPRYSNRSQNAEEKTVAAGFLGANNRFALVIDRHPVYGEVSVSLREEDKSQALGSVKGQWNNSCNLHSKSAASRAVPPARMDFASLHVQKVAVNSSTRFSRFLDREDFVCGEARRAVSDIITIRRPIDLVNERFRRLNMLQRLLRREVEREAMEDWVVLREEFVRIGHKILAAKQSLSLSSGRVGRRSSGQVNGFLGVGPTLAVWEREKRWQERHFQALRSCIL